MLLNVGHAIHGSLLLTDAVVTVGDQRHGRLAGPPLSHVQSVTSPAGMADEEWPIAEVPEGGGESGATDARCGEAHQA